MYRRVAAAAALAVAGLTAGAPMASAATTHASGHTTGSDQRDPKDPLPDGSGNVELLNGLNVLPVQACGLGIPILSGVLDAPDATCSVDNDAAQD